MNELNAMLNKLADIAKPLVEAIEAKPATTKDHYGDYMVAISEMVKLLGRSDSMTSKVQLAVGVALQRAGANKQGVQSALRVMGAI